MNPTLSSFQQILNAALDEALKPSFTEEKVESIETVKFMREISPLDLAHLSLSTPTPLSKAYPRRSIKVQPLPPTPPEEPEILTEKLSLAGAMHLRLIFGRTVDANEKISLKKIKRTYRQKAKELHPDHHPDASGPKLQELNESFGQLKESYRALLIEIKELL